MSAVASRFDGLRVVLRDQRLATITTARSGCPHYPFQGIGPDGELELWSNTGSWQRPVDNDGAPHPRDIVAAIIDGRAVDFMALAIERADGS